MQFKKRTDLDKLEEMESLQNKFKESSFREKVQKKVFSVYLSVDLMEELDSFLKEFGFGETKGSFIENAIRTMILLHKKKIRRELEDKLKKLEE